jgi:DNA-binding response OmpR family regulator
MRVLLIHNVCRLVRAVKEALEKDGCTVEAVGPDDIAGGRTAGVDYDAVLQLDAVRPPWADQPAGSRAATLDTGAAAGRCLPVPGRQSRRPSVSAMIRVDDLQIDLERREVARAGRPILLTPREFNLLAYLAQNQGRFVSAGEIWQCAFCEKGGPFSNIVAVYIRYLRQKIDKGFNRPLILTRWGYGYALRAEGPVAAGESHQRS